MVHFQLLFMKILIYWDFHSNAGLYTTFIFQKPDPEIVPPIATPLLQDATYNHDDMTNDYHEVFYLDVYHFQKEFIF